MADTGRQAPDHSYKRSDIDMVRIRRAAAEMRAISDADAAEAVRADRAAIVRAVSDRIEQEPTRHIRCTDPSPIGHYPGEPAHCAYDRERWPCDQALWAQVLAVIED